MRMLAMASARIKDKEGTQRIDHAAMLLKELEHPTVQSGRRHSKQ